MVTYKYEDSISCVNSAYDSIFVDNCTGIGNRHFDDDSEVLLFPNPNTGSFKIESPSTIERIEIISRTGQLIYSKSILAKRAHISALEIKGVYFVRIFMSGTQKVVNKQIIIL